MAADPAKVLREFVNNFKTPVFDLIPKFEKFKEEWSQMCNEMETISKILCEENQDLLLQKAETINDKKYIGEFYEGMGNKVLTNLGKSLLEKEDNLVLFFIGSNQNGLLFIAMRDEKLNNCNLSVITKEFLGEVKGKGGGKPNLTQGFVPNSLNTEKELVSLFKKYLMQK